MSYTPPNSDFVTALQGTYYSLAHLALASVAYTSQSFPLQIPETFGPTVSGLQQLVNPGANPPYPNVPGSWSLDWGPAFCTNEGGLLNDNLVAIVSYRVSGTPCFFAVLCRGTDVGGGIAQIGEDLGATTQQPWTSVLNGSYHYGGGSNGLAIQSATSAAIPANATGNIATGSADALVAVTNLVPFNDDSGSKNYLAQALLGLLAQYPGTPIVVTGHSLGGALTQVVAAFLSWQVSNLNPVPAVIPQAFAPPTVGDQGFVNYYNGLFQYDVPNANSGPAGSQFWVNTADLVPCAWANLTNASALWGAYNWPSGTPGPSWGPTIAGTGKDLAGQDAKRVEQDTIVGYVTAEVPPYARPANVQLLNPGTTLPSMEDMQAFLTAMNQNNGNWNTWSSQLEYQHFPPQYHALITAALGSNALPFALPSTPSVQEAVLV